MEEMVVLMVVEEKEEEKEEEEEEEEGGWVDFPVNTLLSLHVHLYQLLFLPILCGNI